MAHRPVVRDPASRSPVTPASVRRVEVLARKAVEQARRELRVAPEQLRAYELAQSVTEALRSHPLTGDRPRVMMLTPRSWASHVQWEAVIAQALRLRGADVVTVTCGGGLPICDRVNTYEGPPVPCRSCVGYTVPSLEAHGLDIVTLADGAPIGADDGWPELDDVPAGDLYDVEVDDLALGRLVEVPTKWFLLGTGVEQDPLAALTIRRFLRAGRQVARAMSALIDVLRPDVLFELNGLFFFEAIAAAVAGRRGVDVVSYERGFIHDTLFFRRGMPAASYDIGPLWDRYAETPLDAPQEARLDGYLSGRRRGERMMIVFSNAGDTAVSRPPGGRLVSLFTNITWDSAVIGREVAFGGLSEWLDAAIGAFAARPNHRLVIRVHPAELKLPGKRTREPVAPMIAARWPRLPDNVTVLDADDQADSYTLMEMSDLGLVYTSTVGLEMALAGKPVMTAARTHYRGKGFTVDVSSPAEFTASLDAMLADPAAHAPELERARRYAYAFFFRALVPSTFVREPVPGLARLEVSSAAELAPGASDAIDRICTGILDGGDFSEGWCPESQVM